MWPLSHAEPLSAFKGNLLLETFATGFNYNVVVEGPPSMLPLQDLIPQNGFADVGDAEENSCPHQRMPGRRKQSNGWKGGYEVRCWLPCIVCYARANPRPFQVLCKLKKLI